MPRSNVPWYEKLGFVMFKEDEIRYQDEGREWWATFMRREL
jgi:hypothetical protein